MIETERLILRQWRDEDYPIYAQLNADPEVMRYFPELMSREESDAQIGRFTKHIANKGWGFWAVELKSSGEFIGFIGLHKQKEESGIPHAPLIEAGWRLQARHWGNGYATEGAKRVIRYAFEQLESPEVYAYTPLQHMASQRVMIKAGMTNTGEDFNYPKIPAGHALGRFCLYKIAR
ncbi:MULTISPECIES: GNAT family N-acetyltransferase [Symbiopectobacterium]|uniref:GNAT family N-acetyltransferase n=1 Tax=Symbiopectobacterium TaxID=801 RepID=UPI001A275B26|nr:MULTISPECIES: GNAT family N-acetyltransferase [Symbiopectobacterium]MBG6249241.1 N-acetyltransferase [Candidatus Symbiopectobacterium sp. PLON1]MBT9430747.1 GNAT family N-acetyltransferase [Candidatus Symbiopectobacterium endolongispinus]